MFTSFTRDVLVSGGSSPSREVQEILSLQSNNSGREVQDLINLQPPQRPYFQGDIEPIDIDVKNQESDPLKEIEGVKPNVQSTNGWPHIPLVPESLTKRNDDLTNRINSRVSLEKSETVTENIPESNAWKATQRVEMTLSTILATVQQQESQIRVRRGSKLPTFFHSRESGTVFEKNNNPGNENCRFG